MLVAIEMADRVLELSFRDNPDFDPDVLALGRQALSAFGRHLAGDLSADPSDRAPS